MIASQGVYDSIKQRDLHRESMGGHILEFDLSEYLKCLAETTREAMFSIRRPGKGKYFVLLKPSNQEYYND